MKDILIKTGIVLAACMSAVVATQTVPPPQDPSVPVAGVSPPTNDGLSDLADMTFGCPTAALNAAARRASRVPSQGTYQFAYFNILNDAHHATFEVHFKSNYEGEAELKYCVAMYCQQGWDPATAQIDVTLMSNAPQRAAAHGSACTEMKMPAKQRVPR